MKYHTSLHCPLSEMRKCHNISERLRISPDERLQKLVDEMDIVDGIDDDTWARTGFDEDNADDDEDPELVDDITDKDLRLYDASLTSEAKQCRYNDSITRLNQSDLADYERDDGDSAPTVGTDTTRYNLNISALKGELLRLQDEARTTRDGEESVDNYAITHEKSETDLGEGDGGGEFLPEDSPTIVHDVLVL